MKGLWERRCSNGCKVGDGCESWKKIERGRKGEKGSRRRGWKQGFQESVGKLGWRYRREGATRRIIAKSGWVGKVGSYRGCWGGDMARRDCTTDKDTLIGTLLTHNSWQVAFACNFTTYSIIVDPDPGRDGKVTCATPL